MSSSVKWKGGRDVAVMAKNMQKRFDEVKKEAYVQLEQAAEIGGGRLQDELEAAETVTGIQRVERGGISSGRHESGNMIAAVSYSSVPVSNSRRYGLFGWFSGVYEDYFRLQDKGGQGEDGGVVPAANAMPAAHRAAVVALRARLIGMGLRRR